MPNYSGAGPTICEVCSGTQYLGNSAVATQISDPFTIPAQLLNRVGSRFKITITGQINNGTTPGNVTFSSGGVPAAGVLFPNVVIPSAATPLASTSYSFEITWEWVCQNAVTGNGYMTIKVIIAQMNSWTDPVPLYLNTGSVTEPFGLAAHGGNIDAYYFYILSTIAQAASGTTTFTNYVKFEYVAAPQ